VRADEDLKLAEDSPFRDPDIIYLEADELENDQESGILTANGQVEGRYQDKTLRADKVIYAVNTGRVIAIGNVVLINADGSTQYADKLELSDKLEAGTAANFTSRFSQGGLLASAFAARTTDQGIELYNAYYTACETCRKDDKIQKPTWRIKARKVTQDRDTKSIRYRDAVFEFKGIPIFYTPYLAHPDPSVGRASGWLIPYGGTSNNKGVNIVTPYYFALSPSSELTLTPHVFSGVNPLVAANYRKKFYSGEFNLEGSLTYSSFFDNNGNDFSDADFFADPEESLRSKKIRSHFFSNGLFNINQQWKWGFQAGYATDDNFLDRYGLDEARPKFGLYSADSRRLTQQAFIVGQGDSFRFSTSSFGTVSLRTSVRRDPNNPNRILVSREDDSTLPVIAPKIEATKYLDDPLFGGRLNLFGDATVLTRETGTDYIRATSGLNWQKNWIAPAGIEIKPFAQARFDYFNLEAEGETSFDFSRATGQIGVDARWPLINAGGKVNWLLEPRIQITQNFGDGKLDNFSVVNTAGQNVFLAQDSLEIDLDQSLLWSANKSTGFDLWQEGFRADIGGSLSADWGQDNRATLFLGQSYYAGSQAVFDLASGLQQDKSDIVGLFELELGRRFSTATRVRFDEDGGAFRRLDTSLTYRGDRISTNWRYYRVDSATAAAQLAAGAPTQEISGNITVKLVDNWSAGYRIFHDIDAGTTRRQSLSLTFDDDCTRIELFYTRENNGLGIVSNSNGFGIRVSLLTLGDLG